MPTSLVFPATLVGPLLLAAITSALVFKERLTPAGYVGLTLAAVGLVMLSVNAG